VIVHSRKVDWPEIKFQSLKSKKIILNLTATLRKMTHIKMTFGITTLSMMTLDKMALSIMALYIKGLIVKICIAQRTLSLTTVNIITLCIATLSVSCHFMCVLMQCHIFIFMLSVIFQEVCLTKCCGASTFQWSVVHNGIDSECTLMTFGKKIATFF
jgi:hypothetical protein